MQAHAKLWLAAAVLTTLSSCAEQELADPGRQRIPRTTGSGEDPYDYVPGGNGVGGGAPSGKSGASAAQGGTAGHAGGKNGSSGASSMAGRGGGAAGSAAGRAAAESDAGAAGADSKQDCPSLTLARTPNGSCVPRVVEYDVARSPTSIVLGSDGRIWVDDDGSDQLLQLDDSGQVIGRVSCQPGSSPRALAGGTGDAILWYTDSRENTLVKLTQQHDKVPTRIDFDASALALGRGDEVFLTEFGTAVYRFSPTQSTLTRWESSPTDALVISPDNQAWFSQGSALAQLIPSEGVKDVVLGDSAYASGLCIGPDAGLWFSDGFANQLVRMTWDGIASRTINLPTGTAPGRIITGPDGAFWFVETGTSMIGRVSLQGDITHYPLPTPDSLPHALTVGADGNIWFTELVSHKVARLIPDPLP